MPFDNQTFFWLYWLPKRGNELFFDNIGLLRDVISVLNDVISLWDDIISILNDILAYEVTSLHYCMRPLAHITIKINYGMTTW
jgi:hypothetical protein